MIAFQFQFLDTTKLAATVVKDASFKSVGHLAATIRKGAMASIDISPESSEPGDAPNSRDGRLARAIVFHVDKQTDTAVIGPRKSVVGEAGAAHEHAEKIGITKFPERPFMFPELERNIPRFGETFAASY
jgi:hypothetical protein